ncbi:zinc metalloprotease [Flaviaesturariibacter terrae]
MRFLLLLLTTLTATVAGAQTPPAWNSYPQAASTIFLDFDGHTVSGTQWNVSGPIVCGPANITAAQQTEIFNRISEDYRPFNINITTDSTRYWSAPPKQRMRVIFTVTNGWYGSSAGGVSYINSFSWGDNTPCFVFTALLNYNTKWLAEAGAHEAGHTFGLRHQAAYNSSCVKLTDYNQGTGSGEIGWAPIMGVGYYRNMTTWNLGPNNLGCSTSQSDVDIITKTANGVTFRADDVPDTRELARSAGFGQTFDVQGVIEKRSDIDMFRFTLGSASHFRLDAVPFNTGSDNLGSDLDIVVKLLDADGNQLGVYNPEPLLSSVIDTLLPEGTYFLSVDGNGNQYAPEYGSLGSYSLRGSSMPLTVLPLRVLHLQGRASGGRHSLSWVIDADEAVVGQQLELSDDGRSFRPLTSPAAADRAFSCAAPPAGRRQYRLRVDFENGRSYYSNTIVMAPASADGRPRLLQTVLRGGSLPVQTSQETAYQVGNSLGQLLTHGNIAPGSTSLSLPALPPGAYWIRFYAGGAVYLEKFVQP